MSRIDFIPTKRRHQTRKNGQTYDHPKNVEEAEKIRAAYEGGFFDGAVRVVIDVYGKLPDNTKKSITSEPALVKPDADNISKAILDALNGLAYDDDKQVTSLVVRKHDRTRIERPFVIFDVMPI